MTTGKFLQVAVDDHGRRIGETHHRSKYPDDLVDLIREMYDTGELSAPELADMFALSVNTVKDWVHYRRRAGHVSKFKTIEE